MDAEVAAPADPTLLVDSFPSAANQPPAAANTNPPNDLGDGGNNAGTLNISMYDNLSGVHWCDSCPEMESMQLHHLDQHSNKTCGFVSGHL